MTAKTLLARASASSLADLVDVQIENGTPIVLLPADANTVHLAGLSHNATGRPVELDDHLAAGGWPLEWRTVCGARGHVFVYALMFAHRRTCLRCALHARDAKAAA